MPQSDTTPAELFGFPADDVHDGLCQAAARGEIVEMKRLLDSGASPNSCDEVGLSVEFHAWHGQRSQEALSLLEQVFPPEIHDPPTVLAACATGKEEHLEQLLQQGASLDAVPSPLYVACFYGHKKCVEMLLLFRSQLDVNAVFNGNTPLFIACARGHGDCVEMLLKSAGNRIQVNIRAPCGDTALVAACRRGHPACVEQLLAHPTSEPLNVNYKTSFGEKTALMLAYEYSDSDCHRRCVALLCGESVQVDGLTLLHKACALGSMHLDTLLKFDGDDLMQSTTHEGLTPLHLACCLGQHSVVARLLRQPAAANFVNLQRKLGFTALVDACSKGQPACAWELLKDDRVDVAMADPDGLTALHHACRNGQLDCIRLLLARKPGCRLLNETDHQGNTPLHLACNSHTPACIEPLVEAGADLNRANFGGLATPLHVACARDDDAFLKTLLKVCGDRLQVNLQDALGRTALHILCRAGNSTGIRELRAQTRHLPDISLKDKEGLTPVQIASSLGHVSCIEALDQPVTATMAMLQLHSACKNGDSATLTRLLLGDRSLANLVDGLGNTPLHLACQAGHAECVEALLDIAGESLLVNAKAEDGSTALSIAYENYRDSCIELLLREKGRSLTDINDVFKGGFTALQMECSAGNPARLALLLDVAGLDFNQTTGDNMTPLFIACMKGHSSCVQLLLDRGGEAINVNRGMGDVTPLMIACKYGHSACVRVLLEKARDRVQLNRISEDEQVTLLHQAAKEGNSDIIDALLSVGGDELSVNSPRANGDTPLHVAVTNGHDACCRVLLRHGADPTIANQSHTTAMSLVTKLKRSRPTLVSIFDDMGWIWAETVKCLSPEASELRVFNTTVPVDAVTQLATARVSFALLRTVRLARCNFADGRALAMLVSEQQRQENNPPVHWHLDNCPNLGSDAVVALFTVLLASSMNWTLRIIDCGLNTKGIEQLGSLLFYASEQSRQQIKGFQLSDTRLQAHFETAKALQDSLTRSLFVDMVLLGNGGVGKTQFEAHLRGDTSASVLRTLGANSHQSSLRRQHLSSSSRMSAPRKIALGDTGFFLGDITEVGGQLEYRHLYQFVGSLFRIHVIVLRHPSGAIGGPFPSLESQLNEHLQILACRYPRTSELECPAIIVVVNHDSGQWRRRLTEEEEDFTRTVQNLCHPGMCKTVFVNAKDGDNLAQFHAACGDLWRQRGSFVTSERKRLVDSLHRHVMATCNLQVWSEDCQWIRAERMPVHVLSELLSSLGVPAELHGVATEQLVEACEIVLLPKIVLVPKEGLKEEPQRVVSWPQYVFDIAALLIHHKGVQDTELPGKLPAHQQRDGALLQLIKVLHNFVFTKSGDAPCVHGVVPLRSLAKIMESRDYRLFAASSLCGLMVDLGICFRELGKAVIHIPALLPDALPNGMSRVWPVPDGKHQAIGVCLVAANNGVFPPGLFQRFQVQIGRQTADVALWQRGVAIGGTALARLAFSKQQDESRQSRFGSVTQELLTRCFVRIEQAQNSAVSLYAVCHSQPGQPDNVSEPLGLYTLLQHSISLLDHVRQSSGMVGLSWEEHYYQQKFNDSIFTASRDNPVYLPTLRTLPCALVKAEVLAGSQEHKLTAPHLYVPTEDQQQQELRIVQVQQHPQNDNVVRDFMSRVLSLLPSKHHSFGLNLLPSFAKLQNENEVTAAEILGRDVKLHQHALDLAGYTWSAPELSAMFVDLKTGLHRCGLGFIWAEISPMVGDDVKLPSFGFFKESYAAVDSYGHHDLPIYRALSSAGWTSNVRFEREVDLLTQSNLTTRLLQPMQQFSLQWTPSGVHDEREKQALLDTLDVCGLRTTFGVLEYLQWNSLPVFLFAAELMRGDKPLIEGDMPLWQAIRNSLPPDVSDPKVLKLLDRVFDPELTLAIVAEAPQAVLGAGGATAAGPETHSTMESGLPLPHGATMAAAEIPQAQGNSVTPQRAETVAAAAAAAEARLRFNEALRRDVETLDALFRGDMPALGNLLHPDGPHAAVADAHRRQLLDPCRTHGITLRDLKTKDELLHVLACCALIFRPRTCLFYFTGEGRKVAQGSQTELVFCSCEHSSGKLYSTCCGLTARELSPVLWAIGASTTLVVLDCCFSSNFFTLEMFPGLAVMPVVSADYYADHGFACEVFVPIFLFTPCKEGCMLCQQFAEQFLGRQIPLLLFMEHVRHFLRCKTDEKFFPAFTAYLVGHSPAMFN